MSTAVLIAETLARDADRTCLNYFHATGEIETLEASEMLHHAYVSAGALRALGWGSGDIIPLLLPQSPQAIFSFLGAILNGSVPCFLPHWSNAKAEHVIYQASQACRVLDTPRIITTPQIADSVRQSSAAEGLRIETLDFRATPIPEPVSAIDPDSPAYIQMTSGTTANPKPVFVSHDRLIDHIAGLRQHLGFERDDCIAGWIPYNHDLGLVTNVLLPVIGGGRQALVGADSWLRRPTLLLAAIEACSAGFCFMPNFGFVHMVRHVAESQWSSFDLGCLRSMINGAEPIRAETMIEFSRFLALAGAPATALGGGYGMSENIGGITISRPSEIWRMEWISPVLRRDKKVQSTAHGNSENAYGIVSCGKPIPGTKVSIFGEDGRRLADNEFGEIGISGNSLAVSQTDRMHAFVGKHAEQWFLTGDLGFLRDGDLFIAGRSSDSIIVGGVNISAAALESVAHRVLGKKLRSCAAFALNDEHRVTERPVLVCQFWKNPTSVQSRKIVRQLRSEIRNSLGVDVQEIVISGSGSIVTGSAGKVSRGRTRERYLERSSGARPRTISGIDELLESYFSSGEIEFDKNLLENGLTSIRAVEFIIELEQLVGKRLDDTQVYDATLQKIIALANGGKKHDFPAAEPRKSRLKLKRKGSSPFEQMLLFGPRRLHYLPLSLMNRVHGAMVERALGNGAFEAELEHVRAWHRELECQVPLDEILRTSIRSNTWLEYYDSVLQHPKLFDRWVHLKGETKWFSSPPDDRAIIYAFTHSGKIALPLRQMISRTGKPTLLFANKTPGRGKVRRLSRRSDRSRTVRDAIEILDRKGALLIAADGQKSDRMIGVPFFGRIKQFATGVAELALRQDALIVPVFLEALPRGGFVLEIASPLVESPEFASDSASALTATYARLYEQKWPNIFQSMHWRFLERNFHLPANTAELPDSHETP